MIYILTMPNGAVHSFFSELESLMAKLDDYTPDGFDPDTWHIVAGFLNVWDMPRVDTVSYVKEAMRS